MKVTIDVDTCIGCGLCVQIEPLAFEIELDKAVVKSDIGNADPGEVRRASDQCPVDAIRVSE
ncbi:MAG: ferredoxin [Candidatus Omnitrophica bacterium]|nr:ferredoxin [Candidatus Omnitrophota bacterium]